MKVGVAGPGLMAFWVAPSIVELGIEVGAVYGTPESIGRARELCEKCGTSAENAYADYDGFQAVGICAKDCGSPSWTSVQGEDGYIYTDTPANLMTKVTLHLNDGTEEEFVDDCTTNWVYEWGLFLKDLESGSTERCYKALDTTLAVARTLTRARLSAGVRFPADEQ